MLAERRFFYFLRISLMGLITLCQSWRQSAKTGKKKKKSFFKFSHVQGIGWFFGIFGFTSKVPLKHTIRIFFLSLHCPCVIHAPEHKFSYILKKIL